MFQTKMNIHEPNNMRPLLQFQDYVTAYLMSELCEAMTSQMAQMMHGKPYTKFILTLHLSFFSYIPRQGKL